MALLIAPILFAAAVLYIAYPLLKEEEETEAWATEEKSAADKAHRDKNDIIDVLRDIDMDYRMGKLSKQDYEALKDDYESRAVEVFQKLQSLQKRGDRARKKKS
ncbi:MAG: hypothetical protein IIB03_09325 [Acidobacteria bacterium]|nr:hypothetical protein [Acidobacteriota bacterium]